MRRTTGTSDEEEPGAPASFPTAADLGWDDSLYERQETPARDTAQESGTVHGAAGEANGARGLGGDTADTGESEAAAGDADAGAGGSTGGAGGGRSGTPPEDTEGPDDPDHGDADGHGADGAGEVSGAAATPSSKAEAKTEKKAAKKAAKRQRPRWVKALIAVTASLAVLATTGGVAGYFYLNHLNNNLTTAEPHLGDNKLDKPPPNEDGQSPLNILAIGSDARDSEENLDLGGARETADGPPIADMQMLIHVAADRSNMTVISIPRDTRVAMPACTDPETGERYEAVESDTINHSLQRGGPGCTVATWEELTGVPIDHFMMLDFTGVVSMADAVGGVPVCVDQNIDDHRSDLRLEAGETTIEGEQALQWLRTRHGFEDGSDVARTKAQHLYLNSMVRELQAGTKLSDPVKLNSLAQAATNALTVDTGLGSVNRLYELGEDLRDVPSERINMITMPWQPAPNNPAHVVPEPGAAEELFSLVRDDIPLDEADRQADAEDEDGTDTDGEDAGGADADAAQDGESAGPEAAAPETIPVAVRNGTGSVSLAAVTGRAGDIANELYAHGFNQAWIDERPTSQPATMLLHPETEQDRANAALVAESLDLPDSAVRPSTQTDGLTLIIGTDWREGTTFPTPPDGHEDDGDEAEEQGSRLDRDDALSGDDDSACMTVNPDYTW